MNQNEKYCYAKTLVTLVTQQPTVIPQKTLTTPTVIPGCSPPCSCRKPQDAAATGCIACGGTTIPCGYDQSQKPMYCYKPLVSQTTIPVTPLIPVLPSPTATPVKPVTAVTPVLPSPTATPVQPVAAITPVPVVASCSDTIRGRIDNLTVNPATVGIELCRTIEVTPRSGTGTGSSGTMSASSRFIVGNGLGNRLAAFGISTPVNQLNEEMFRHIEEDLPLSELGWVCDPSSSHAYTTLSPLGTFEFSRLCPGTYKISPFYRPSGDECRWTGTFWDETLTKGGPRIVNSSNASEALNVRFVFRPLDTTPPEITFRFDPEYPSMRDGFRIIAEASDESGIAKISMNGVVVKNMRARTHCRIERVEMGHSGPAEDREVCDWEEYGISEPFERNCTSSDECSVDIAPEPRATDNSQGEGITGYTITVNATACDRAGMKQSAGKYYQRLPVPRPPLEFAPHSYEVWKNESLRPNAWNETMYRDQEVYLIPDTDWHAVLEVMSVTQWPDTESTGRSRYDRNYPLIIYHQEPDGTFDIDAAVDFIRQYRAQYVTVFFPHHINYDPRFDDAIRDHIANSGIVETWDTYPPRHDPVTIGWYDDDPNATVRLIDFDPENPSTLYDRFYSVQNKIMVVPDDYPTALDASVISGYYHLPIYFLEYISTEDYEGRNVTAVRLPESVRNRIRTSAASVNDGKNDPAFLRDDFISRTEGRTILVNPKDIDEGLRLPGIEFYPDIHTGSPITAYGRMSLAAPYLAIARREHLIQYSEDPFMLPDDTCSSPNHEALIAWKTRAVSDISPRLSGGSLTILADPRYIPDSYYRGCDNGAQVRTQVDRDYNPHGEVGRIYGLTVTDASAYVARSLSFSFSSLIAPTTGGYTGSDYNIASLLIAHSIDWYQDSAERIYDWGYNTHMECHIGRGYATCERNISPPADAYSDQRIILFLDHGDQEAWYNTIAGWQIPRALGMPVVFGDACSTNNFWSGGKYTMGPWWIRKGAIAYYGAVGVSQSYYCDGFGHSTSNAERFMNFWWDSRSGTSLGGLNNAMDSCTEHCRTVVEDCSFHDDFLLLGDPLYRLTPLVAWDRYTPDAGEADCGYC